MLSVPARTGKPLSPRQPRLGVAGALAQRLAGAVLFVSRPIPRFHPTSQSLWGSCVSSQEAAALSQLQPESAAVCSLMR